MFLYTYHIILLQYNTNNMYPKHQMWNDMPVFWSKTRLCFSVWGVEWNQLKTVRFFHPWLRRLWTRCTFLVETCANQSVKQIYEWDLTGLFLWNTPLFLLVVVVVAVVAVDTLAVGQVVISPDFLRKKTPTRHPLFDHPRHRRLADRSALCTGASGGSPKRYRW